MPIKSFHWFIEALGPDEGHLHGVRRALFSTQTPFQSLDIMELGSYGKALILDGKIQSSLLDEFIYHETLVHPAMLSHPAPKRVFIVGGGEGATLREVLRHPTVERALMVDIDEEVVNRCKELLPEWHKGAFDDPRAEVRFLDARRYLEETDERFDVIIIDISEPVEEGPAYLLFTREFYHIVHRCLTDQGVIALQAGAVSLSDLSCFTAIHQTLRTVFPVVAPYWATIPSFALPWGFSIASKGADPRAFNPDAIDRLIAERMGCDLRYYDGQTHQMSFLLPKYVRQRLEEEKRIIEDNAPLFTFH
ncbi:MAG: polyamine aminopropyltransferase [Candidatus Methylomirabilota bacterium]|nr:polyamine aminopropyltransferase [Candidatus Methylomirabilis sp.]NJD67253.1 polyamine aminopropyltransferase [candidate division NC10 bacterium]PWB47347.1 MAG: polyamine aminopropyltransferase [candidate division NC10 bacterium]